MRAWQWRPQNFMEFHRRVNHNPFTHYRDEWLAGVPCERDPIYRLDVIIVLRPMHRRRLIG